MAIGDILYISGHMFQRQWCVVPEGECRCVYCSLPDYMKRTKGFTKLDENGLWIGCWAKGQCKCTSKCNRQGIIVKTWLPLNKAQLKEQRRQMLEWLKDKKNQA